jgi:HD-like signal output (HDOD) protein/DNA-binding NarL/FixJ family response regulator
MTIKPVSVLIMTASESISDAIISAFGNLHITFLKSKPSYTNYLKTLQYLPGAIVVELPPAYHDQLHFIQMIKQNSIASDIPVICFGHQFNDDTVRNLMKIGIARYFNSPFDVKNLASVITELIKKRGFVLSERSVDPEKEKNFDIAQILSVNVTRIRKAELMVKHVSDMMPFPFTVSMTLQLLNSSNTNANDLARTIETDPVIAANFLKKANSVSIAGKNARIITMKDAIVRIGFTETRRIITGMAVMQLFDSEKLSPGFNRIRFWLHCLATAKIAEQLAQLSQSANRDEAFLAGILHDFGIVMLNEFFPTLFSKILQISTDYGMRFSDTEEQIIAISHNDIVRRLFDSWKIPERINGAVANHYGILSAPLTQDNIADPLAVIIAIANILAKAYRIGASCDQFIVPVDNSFFSAIRLPSGLPESFYPQIIDSIRSYTKLLKIDGETLTTEPAAPRFRIGIIDFSGALCQPVVIYLRQTGHVVVEITPSEPPESFAGAFDIAIAFTNSVTDRRAIEKFMTIPAHPQKDGPEDSGQGVRLTPLVVLINRQSPCVAAVNISGVSILPAAIDLRMLDLHLDAVTRGRQIRILPWESVLKPTAPPAPEQKTRSGEILDAFALAARWKTRCGERGIGADELRPAEGRIEKARDLEKEGNLNVALLHVKVAVELFRKSYFKSELTAADNTIRELSALLKEL